MFRIEPLQYHYQMICRIHVATTEQRFTRSQVSICRTLPVTLGEVQITQFALRVRVAGVFGHCLLVGGQGIFDVTRPVRIAGTFQGGTCVGGVRDTGRDLGRRILRRYAS